MSERQRREPYKDNKTKKYEELKKYFFSELEIDYCLDNSIPEVDIRINDCRVWLLFASNDGKEWDCVQVAHSKTDVMGEVKFAINNLFSGAYEEDNCKLSDSQFYKKICPIVDDRKMYRNMLYSKIGTEYTMCKFCFLNVNEYLGIKQDNKTNRTDIERITEICKNQYAEAKIAFQTLSAYWRKVSSSIDGQTISYAVEHRKEFEE